MVQSHDRDRLVHACGGFFASYAGTYRARYRCHGIDSLQARTRTTSRRDSHVAFGISGVDSFNFFLNQ
jgi:hypothetical protein